VEALALIKAGKAKGLVVPADVWGYLMTYIAPRADDPEAPVFISPNLQRFNQRNFYGRFFRPAVKAALPPHLSALRFHDLRQTPWQ